MPARAPEPETGDPWVDLAHAVLGMEPQQRMVFLSALDPPDLALIEHAIALETGRGDRLTPATLAAALDPRFRVHPHIALLGAKFRDACDGTSKRQLWSLPSRYQKTTVLSWGVTWAQDITPEGKWIYLTYGDELAAEFGISVRDRFTQYGDHLSTRLRQDVRRKDRFLNTDGGGLLCRGVNSGVIGFGANRKGGLILDDPMKNWTEAHSKARRDHLSTLFTGTFRHRLDDEDAPIIVCHARWHLEDLTGYLLARMEDETGEAWEHVRIPALAIDPVGDLLGRAVGEPIAPDLFSAEQVASRHRGLVSSFVVAAIEQQTPLADEGDELKREWFAINLPGEMPTAADRAITSWDLKLKDREAGDYVVGQVWWKVGSGYWLMDQIRGQYDHATTENAVALLAVRHPEVTRNHLEAAASAPEVEAALRKAQPDYVISEAMAERLGMTPDEREQVEALRRGGMGNVECVPVKGDKSVRARAYIAPAAEHGHVHLPAEAPWLAGWMDEAAGFPRGTHDDQIDAASQALRILTSNPGVISMPQRGQRPTPRPAGRTLQRPSPR